MAISINKPVVGGDNGTWGTKLNTVLDDMVTEINRIGNLPSGGTGGIPATTVTAKGDLLVATASGTVSRIGVGSNGQVLTADATTGTGVAWKTPTTTGAGIAPGTLVLKATKTNTQTIATTASQVALNSVDYVNTAAGFTNASTITTYTPGIAGYYEITGGVSFTNASDTTIRGVYLTQNNIEILGSGTSCAAANGLATSLAVRPSVVYCNATANIALWAYQATGANLSTYYGSSNTQWGTSLVIKYLGAA